MRISVILYTGRIKDLLSPSFVFDSFGLKFSLIVILTIFLIRQIRQNYQHMKICSSTVVCGNKRVHLLTVL